MDIKKIFSKKRLLFILIFTIMVFVGKKINFSPVLGVDNQFFTLFQFFGPIAGAFLGPIYGVITVLGAEMFDFFVVGKEWSIINLIRLTPMLFAAYYFGTKEKLKAALIPIIAAAIFLLHPVGRQGWVFGIYWPIAIAVKLLPAKFGDSVVARSLGSTFTAHAVGSAAFIWTVPTTAEFWIALTPIVFMERMLFAGGIALSYYGMNFVLSILVDKLNLKIPSDILHLHKKKHAA